MSVKENLRVAMMATLFFGLAVGFTSCKSGEDKTEDANTEMEAEGEEHPTSDEAHEAKHPEAEADEAEEAAEHPTEMEEGNGEETEEHPAETEEESSEHPA